MITTLPLDEITVEAVAERAQVSRALVFHYFPTLRDLHAAAAHVAAHELVTSIAKSIEGREPGYRFGAGLAAFVDFVEVRPQTFQAISALAVSDDEFGALFEGVRWHLVELMLEHTTTAHTPDEPRDSPEFTTQMTRGWVAMAESVTQQWALEKSVSKETLISSLIEIGRSMNPGLDRQVD